MRDYFYITLGVLSFIGLGVICGLNDEGILSIKEWFISTLCCEAVMILSLYKLKAFIFQRGENGDDKK